MFSKLKLYAGLFVTGLIGVLFALFKIQSSRLDKAKDDLKREKAHKEAAQEAQKAISEAMEFKDEAEAIRDHNRGATDNRNRLRKYARD